MSFTPEITRPGDRWDIIAKRVYGDPFLGPVIMAANPSVSLEAELPAGITLAIPIRTDPVTGEDLPPWKTDEGDVVEPPEATPGTPVITDPVVPLAFAATYPKVAGSKVLFAINRTAQYPWSVERVNQGVVASSPLYSFTSGFPVSTPDLVEGDYYVVKVGSLTSGLLTVPGTAPMAFVQSPSIIKTGDTWALRYSINKRGAYLTKVTDTDSDTVVYSQTMDYTASFVVTIPISEIGNYKLELWTLTYNFTVSDVTESDVVPAYLTNAGYRYDANSHDFTLVLGATEPVQTNITAAVGGNPSGINQDSVAWDYSTYNSGRTDYVSSPYTQRFSFNPSVAATGGLLPDTQYVIRVRTAANPSEVFLFLFRTPSTSTPSGDPTVIDLDTPDDNACTVRPTIDVILNAKIATTTFRVLGSGFNSLKWKQTKNSSGLVIDSGTVAVIVNGVAVFSPPNQITINHVNLIDGDDYTLEIEGGSCVSTPHTMSYTVDDDGGDPGPTPDPGSGIYTPVIGYNNFEDMLEISVTGASGSTSKNWRITATSPESVPSGYQYWFFLNNVLVKSATLLNNYPYKSNEPLNIVMMIVKIGLTTLFKWEQPGGANYIPGFSDPDAAKTMNMNTAMAQIEVGFQEVSA